MGHIHILGHDETDDAIKIETDTPNGGIIINSYDKLDVDAGHNITIDSISNVAEERKIEIAINNTNSYKGANVVNFVSGTDVSINKAGKTGGNMYIGTTDNDSSQKLIIFNNDENEIPSLIIHGKDGILLQADGNKGVVIAGILRLTGGLNEYGEPVDASAKTKTNTFQVLTTSNTHDSISLNAAKGGVDIITGGVGENDENVDKGHFTVNSSGHIHILGHDETDDAIKIETDTPNGGIIINSFDKLDIDAGHNITINSTSNVSEQRKIDIIANNVNSTKGVNVVNMISGTDMSINEANKNGGNMYIGTTDNDTSLMLPIFENDDDNIPSLIMHGKDGISLQADGSKGVVISGVMRITGGLDELGNPVGSSSDTKTNTFHVTTTSNTHDSVLLNAANGGVDIITGGIGETKGHFTLNTLGHIHIVGHDETNDAIKIETDTPNGGIIINSYDKIDIDAGHDITINSTSNVAEQRKIDIIANNIDSTNGVNLINMISGTDISVNQVGKGGGNIYIGTTDNDTSLMLPIFENDANEIPSLVMPVSYTHLTLPTTPYV